MEERVPLSAAERIERAINRIEAVLAARAKAQRSLEARHLALREQVHHAIAQLDGVLDEGAG